MKTIISKSEVFKRAWKMFKDADRPAFVSFDGNFYSLNDFAGCLSAAWGIEKSNAAYYERKRVEAEKIAEQTRLREYRASAEYKKINFTPSVEYMESYYRSGAYSGD